MHPLQRQHIAPARHGVWGSYDSSVNRYGMVCEHLRVLPPDITPGQRRMDRAAQIWAPVGFLLGAAVLATLTQVVHPLAATAAAVTIWLVPLVWLAHCDRHIRSRTREVWAMHSLTSDGGPYSHVEVTRAAARLAAADVRRRSGRLGEREFALVWARVYESLETPPATSSTAMRKWGPGSPTPTSQLTPGGRTA